MCDRRTRKIMNLSFALGSEVAAGASETHFNKQRPAQQETCSRTIDRTAT
uniref:Uncharacterized protein n=1 Tax=Anopheles quadriannulatus TaxID=34691 RepID=A0A182XRZ2_ANOQN